jgi:hypothetical protein
MTPLTARSRKSFAKEARIKKSQASGQSIGDRLDIQKCQSTALRAKTFTPCTPNWRAVFSLDVARKQSNRAVMCTSSRPIHFKYATSSASGRAPAIQPVHKSILRRIFSESSTSSAMSPRCSRPPALRIRTISLNTSSFSGTRLRTPLEMTTSTLRSETGSAVASPLRTSICLRPVPAAEFRARPTTDVHNSLARVNRTDRQRIGDASERSRALGR